MAKRKQKAKVVSTSKARAQFPLRIAKLLLDRKNVALLRLLRQDPRSSVTELARRIDMSAPTVRERVARLEEAGVIAGWRLELDPVALGYPVLAFVRVRPLPGALPKIVELAQRIAQVVECHRVTGEDCFIMKVRFVAIDELEEVLDRFLEHGETTTSIVNATPVAPRDLPLPP